MFPQLLEPCSAPFSSSSLGITISGKLLISGGKLKITQWIQVPPGASGSSHIKAILPLSDIDNLDVSQSRGGEIFEPSQVYLGGMGSPSLNTGLEIFKTIKSPLSI
jgi:hypothetical protein